MEVDLPNIPSSFYKWEYRINTDSSWIHEGIPDYEDPIVLGACVNRHM